MAYIRIEKLTVLYPAKKKTYISGTDELDISFEKNTFNVIVGESGSGKSSILKAITGQVDYDGGVFVNDNDFGLVDVNKKNIGYVTQQYSLYPKLNIFDNIAFPLKNAHFSREEIIQKVESIAEYLKISYLLTRKPKHLSGGQQQRVALARALVKKPDILLLDEPFSNVDVPERKREREFVKEVTSKNKCTVIYVTHDINEAVELAEKIFVIKDGKVDFEGTVNQFKTSKKQSVRNLIDNA